MTRDTDRRPPEYDAGSFVLPALPRVNSADTRPRPTRSVRVLLERYRGELRADIRVWQGDVLFPTHQGVSVPVTLVPELQRMLADLLEHLPAPAEALAA
jgi:hypothetical protein